MNSFNPIGLGRWYRTLRRDPAIAAVFSFIIGGVSTSLWPRTVAVIAALLIALLVARRLFSLRKARAFSGFERSLFQPDGAALARAHHENFSCLVMGQVLEVKPHSTLSSRIGISNVGWDPRDIPVALKDQEFDARPVLEACGGYQEADPPNGRKFCLAECSIGGTDDSLSLTLKASDYFTIQSTRTKVESQPELRRKFGKLDPRYNGIPHSLCLHMIVQFADGAVLALRNDEGKAYEPGAWAISAEEQIRDSDVDSDHPIETHFQRALCEEVFGLSDNKKPLSTRWNLVKDRVRSMRIASLFVEERVNNFSLLGICQLHETPDSFVASTRELIGKGEFSLDLEGKMYWFPETELRRLLVAGAGEAIQLFGSATERVAATELHSTSRYRAYRLLRALRGDCLEPPDET